MLEMNIRICLKRADKKRIHKRIQKKSIQNMLKKIKENNELKSVEIDVVTNFIKDEVESSSDAEVYTDDESE